jgi:hypothetical protein
MMHERRKGGQNEERTNGKKREQTKGRQGGMKGGWMAGNWRAPGVLSIFFRRDGRKDHDGC